MFGVDSGELFIIVLVAVMVIGPKELPRVMRTVGRWVGKARGMANQFRSGVDQMVRETEIADLEKKWREQNDAIMRAHPMAPPESDWGLAPPVSLDKGGPTGPMPPLLSKPEKAAPREAAPVAVAETARTRRMPIAPKLAKPADAKPRAEGETA